LVQKCNRERIKSGVQCQSFQYLDEQDNVLLLQFFHGAEVGDLFMGMIHACPLWKANPFDLLLVLQNHSPEVFRSLMDGDLGIMRPRQDDTVRTG